VVATSDVKTEFLSQSIIDLLKLVFYGRKCTFINRYFPFPSRRLCIADLLIHSPDGET